MVFYCFVKNERVCNLCPLKSDPGFDVEPGKKCGDEEIIACNKRVSHRLINGHDIQPRGIGYTMDGNNEPFYWELKPSSNNQ